MAVNVGISIAVDIHNFVQSLTETSRELEAANRSSVTKVARQHLFGAVKHDLPLRTGNLRSAATVPWQRLGLPGKPMTAQSPGVKEATVTLASGRRKRVKLYSRGVYLDRRSRESPEFEYALYAAEWRGRYGRGAKSIQKALSSGLLGTQEVSAVRRMMAQHLGEEQVMGYITDILSGTGRGRSWLIGNGAWRPYHHYFKGNRAMMREQEVFEEQRQTLRKHSAR